MDKINGEPLQDYANRRLFEPVGMLHTSLRSDAAGHAWTYADAKTTLRDFARIGILMMNDGKWNEKQVVPAAWIHDCIQLGPNQSDTYLPAAMKLFAKMTELKSP